MLPRSSLLVPSLLALLVAVSPALAQGTKADYDRSASLRQRANGKVVRDRVTPHWLDGERFWYKIDLPGGKSETWLVDARTAQKTPYEVPANAEGDSLKLLPARALRSRSGGGETEVVFENRTKGPVQLWWMESPGERRDYGTIPAGGTRPLHTFAGHAWLITTADGKTLGGFIAEERRSKAIITGEVAAGGNGPNFGRIGRSGSKSPDEKWTAFLRDRNLWLRDSADKETQLTTDGTAEKYLDAPLAWSPDSRKLVAFRTVPAQEHKVSFVESSPKDQVQPKLHTIDYLKPGDRIAVSKPCLFEVASRREIPISSELFANPWSNDSVHWDPDSKHFSFLFNQRGHQVLRIVGVDAETGAARPVVDEQSKTFIDYAGKFFCRYLDSTGEILWMSERDGWNHLYLYDAKTGQVKNQVTRGPWVVRAVDRVDPEKRQVWFQAGGIYPHQDPYYVHYCRVNFDGTGLVKLTEGDGTHTLEYGPDRRFYVDSYSRVDMPAVSELRRAEDGKLVMPLEKGDWSELLSNGWQVPERFVAKARDGKTDIYGVIFRPSNFDAAKKYPVIEDIYAGPQSAFVPKGFQPVYSQQGLAELGFIVVKIDGMGTSQRSKAFHDVCWKNLVDAGLPDRILWTKAAAAKHPEMDLTRVGIFGTSAGGQNSLGAMLTHPEFYKVCVSACGCHDNRMDKIWWNELWMGWPVGPHYEAQSNVTLAHQLQGKLLLIVGEMDTNVDPATTMQVVDRLIKANKDFELLVVPGAGHGMGGAYGQRRMQDFFVRNLLGAEPRRASP